MAPPLSDDRIAELLSPFLGDNYLPGAQLYQVSTYLDLLVRWNAKINLTAIRDPEEIVARHFGESFFAARHLAPPFGEVGSNNEHQFIARTALDIGSGAGFPGLPIKILTPEIEITLVESNQKKVSFLREVIRSLKLTDVNVWPKRAEQLNCTADLVTLRAVEQFGAILPTAARLVSPGGRLALLIGISQFETAKSALANYMFQIGAEGSQIGKVAWAEPISIPLSRNRVLAIAAFG